MTSYKRGDVLLVIFPFSDLVQYKKRPAVVVQADGIEQDEPTLLVAQITSQQWRQGASRVPVALDSQAGRDMGILRDSVIVADKINTVSPEVVLKQIGACPIMTAVDEALRVALRL